VDELIYFSHWMTPVGIAKRFDARYFLTTAPLHQHVEADGSEMVDHLCVRPAEVITRDRAAFNLPNATHQTLTAIARFTTVAELLQWAREPREIRMMQPRIAVNRSGRHSVLPHEPAWVEVGKLDPQGLGIASSELIPGQPVRLSQRVIRVTADNGSIMTGPGTNTYLVGGGASNEWAVIDPGPPDAIHVDAIMAAAPGPIRWILATHTHKDHSPAVELLKAKTNAVVYGQVAEHLDGQDTSFAPDEVLRGGERIALPGDTTLRVIHTPGHASNHLCYLLEQEQILFTGDHIMQASTVVINPPDGNMSAYIASLRALLNEDIEWLAPGHGFLMAEPRRVVEGIIQHRFKREAKVIAAMQAMGPASMEALLVKVYDDVDQRLHKVALRSLYAHLLKLQDDRVVAARDDQWSLVVK
jgi:glyoxylase-like metal-dependent hydrolase (beta-lactamase superfamily II)